MLAKIEQLLQEIEGLQAANRGTNWKPCALNILAKKERLMS